MPVVTRCALCGKKYEIAEDNPDYQKLISKPSATYICDMCKNKVRFSLMSWLVVNLWSLPSTK